MQTKPEMFYWSFTSFVHFLATHNFYPHDVMLARFLPSKDVCPSVCLSVTGPLYCVYG